MKRFSSSPETLGSLFYPPPQEKKNQKSDFLYDTDFQAMLDGIEEDDCTEESSQSSEKKRRLSFDQVKALEKIFEVENKLDPERKVKIAQELGLQPRQVAIWFQNRRARSKTKRLEKDYDILRASYEDLKLNFEKLKTEKEGLAAELKEHKMKLREEGTETKSKCEKERTFLLKTETNACEQSNAFHHKHEIPNTSNGKLVEEMRGQVGFRDGLSECSNFSASSSSSVLQYECSASVKSSEWIMNCYDHQFLGASPFQVNVGPQQCWLGTEQEAATTTNIFSLDQAHNIQWHY